MPGGGTKFLALLGVIFTTFVALPATASAGSAHVAALQVAMRALALYPHPIDGVSGPWTQQAVRTFQGQHRLAVDGVAGTQTRAVLGWRGKPLLGARPMRIGKRGWDVAALQFLLSSRGFGPGDFDGGFGPNTESAVRRYQAAAALTVDGIAGPSTIDSLRGTTVVSAPGGPVRFVRPLPGPIGDGFGWIPPGRRHTGIDFPAAKGTPIGAGGRGTVVFAGFNTGGYGNLVVVRHRLGFESWYAHLSVIAVSAGQAVAGGSTPRLRGLDRPLDRSAPPFRGAPVRYAHRSRSAPDRIRAALLPGGAGERGKRRRAGPECGQEAAAMPPECRRSQGAGHRSPHRSARPLPQVAIPRTRAIERALSSSEVFDQLSERLQTVLSGVRSRGKLSEEDVKAALREVRLALLEADVNFKVVKDFTAALRERLAGEQVSEALNPGQMVIKAVNDELTELMGGAGRDLVFAPRGADRRADRGPAGIGEDDSLREAGEAAEEAAQGRRPRRMRPTAPRGGRAAGEARRPGEGPRLLPARRDRRRQGRLMGPRGGKAGEPRRSDRRHRRPPPRRSGADGRARGGAEGDEAARHPPGSRRDDGPGCGQRRRELRRRRPTSTGC